MNHYKDSIEARLAHRIEAWRRDVQPTGLAVSACLDGSTLFCRGFGHIDRDHRALVTDRTLFQLASVGKHITSMLALSLIERGVLELDATLPQLLREAPPHWSAITIRQLLQHRSGLPDYLDFVDVSRDSDDDAFIAEVAPRPLDFAPGTQSAYSNTGYSLLGIAMTRVLGKHWFAGLQELLFAPLGMTDTVLASDVPPTAQRAVGVCRTSDDQVLDEPAVSSYFNTTADGALVTSARDLSRWSLLLQRPQLAIDSLWTVDPLPDGDAPLSRFGMGLSHSALQGTECAYFAGWWQGAKSGLAHYPEKQLTLWAMSNSEWTDPLSLCRRLAHLIDPTIAALDRKSDDALALTGALDRWLRDCAISDREMHAPLSRQQTSELRALLQGASPALPPYPVSETAGAPGQHHRLYAIPYKVGESVELLFARVQHRQDGSVGRFTL